MYTAYCAVCHGLTGKGDGPAAPALKTPAANLTELSKNNGGKYPALRVEAILDFGVPTAAHGSKDMPIWGPLFDSLVHNATRAETHLRIMNLTDYLKTLQVR